MAPFVFWRVDVSKISLIKETDPVTLITEEVFYDEDTDELSFQRYQDAGAILEINKKLYNEHVRPDYSDSKGVHLVAQIPLIMVEHWRTQGFDWFKSTDNERRAWLDRPEHQCFKVRPGRLGGTPRASLTMKVG